MNSTVHISPPLLTAEHTAQSTNRQGASAEFEVTSVVRWRDAIPELQAPAVPFPSSRIFEIAGEEALRALVRCHHERLFRSSLRA
jgi:hypothetical protein